MPLLPRTRLELAHPFDSDALDSFLEASFAEAGIERGRLRYRASPHLEFDVTDGTHTQRLRYELRGSTVRGIEPREVGTRRFLTRMHTARGYPDRFGIRWIWALLVDVMAITMLLWGLTGLLMWWQLRKLRRIGTWVLAASVVVTALVFVGMHGVLAAP